ncbi:hypothetical protein CVIRNUC_001830 [Coccomyxa viridis]|uniref:Prolyl 4-hydroxylase alpha subunit Fe(2+) 2OG dioxygenase domain-containing protein n=1 Tax=Coccomyxa viridis TaxID=1274662 RepID=A0AAV1HV64_9CHLO|nr:hypothetical protein CVIRNUC_001830 [Coccomyxa viridis]
MTIAGGAAVWGMLLMSVHLFCHSPSEMQPAMKMRLLRSPARVRLQQVCHDGQLLMSGHRAQPLLSLRHTYLPKKVLQRLQESLLFRWPLLDAAELADGYNAISVDMNMQGWPRLQAACLQHGSRDAMHPSSRPCLDGEAPLSELHDLGQRLRAPWANAWSLNIVYAQPTDVKRAGQTGPQDPHIDNLRLQDGDHACSVASTETSVLYLQVPEDMQGGELTVAGSDMDPEEHVQPETNLLVRFRGNATHRVEEFMSQSQRISITLEQYDLPLEVSRFVPEYQFRRLQY